MDSDLMNMPVSFRGVPLPHAQLLEFDPETGEGKVRLTPNGPPCEFTGGSFEKPPEPDDADAVLEALENALREDQEGVVTDMAGNAHCLDIEGGA